MTDAFFASEPQTDIDIRGVAAKSPLFYPDLGFFGFVCAGDAAEIARRLPTLDHRPWRAWPGRALVAVQCFEYRDTQIGPYNEVALTAAVDLGSRPRPWSARVGSTLLGAEAHGFILDLPVDTEVALHGGLDYFNYPKHLADIRFSESAGSRTCAVRDRDGGALIVEISAPAPAARGPRDLLFHSYPILAGQAVHARFRVRADAFVFRPLPTGVRVRLGDHPRAEVWRALRLGRPLATFFAPRGRGILYPPRDAAGSAS